ncbi:MAG TPA: hypothetical protein VFR07_01220 [Mycobacteriales bacterium]|jgi:hypothetical protein|nr:hypothetical protein [Mycobacteriales bacterium]
MPVLLFRCSPVRLVLGLAAALLVSLAVVALAWQPAAPLPVPHAVAATATGLPAGVALLLVDDPTHPGRLHLQGVDPVTVPLASAPLLDAPGESALALSGVLVLAGAGLGAGVGRRTVRV